MFKQTMSLALLFALFVVAYGDVSPACGRCLLGKNNYYLYDQDPAFDVDRANLQAMFDCFEIDINETDNCLAEDKGLGFKETCTMCLIGKANYYICNHDFLQDDAVAQAIQDCHDPSNSEDNTCLAPEDPYYEGTPPDFDVSCEYFCTGPDVVSGDDDTCRASRDYRSCRLNKCDKDCLDTFDDCTGYCVGMIPSAKTNCDQICQEKYSLRQCMCYRFFNNE
jgi:hypothetical protein